MIKNEGISKGENFFIKQYEKIKEFRANEV